MGRGWCIATDREQKTRELHMTNMSLSTAHQAPLRGASDTMQRPGRESEAPNRCRNAMRCRYSSLQVNDASVPCVPWRVSRGRHVTTATLQTSRELESWMGRFGSTSAADAISITPLSFCIPNHTTTPITRVARSRELLPTYVPQTDRNHR